MTFTISILTFIFLNKARLKCECEYSSSETYNLLSTFTGVVQRVSTSLICVTFMDPGYGDWVS